MATNKSRQGQTKAEKDSSGSTKMKLTDIAPAINKWSTSAVKNTVDDTVKKIMKEEYSCEEDFKLMDFRLFICTVACSFSLFALAYDYINPFPLSRTVLAVCAICYFLMMGVLTLFTVYMEDNTFMVALEKDQAGVGPDKVWTFQSTLPRFSDSYTLKVTYRDGQSTTTREEKIVKSVASWFDEEGKIQGEKLFMDVKKLHTKLKSKKEN